MLYGITIEMQQIVVLATIPLLFIVSGAVSNHIIATSPTPSLIPKVIVANYTTIYSDAVNSTVEYVFLYSTNNNTHTETARIMVERNATHDLPLIVVVRQKMGILSWRIPLQVEKFNFHTQNYSKTSRILCSSRDYHATTDEQTEFVSVSISTASPDNIFFKLSVTEVEDFNIKPGGKRVVQISPAEPVYYGYTFPSQPESSSVIVRVDSNNDICMTVSIQNKSCPVFDLERNVEFSGYWQTMSRRGGITVSREEFPEGFFVVLVVKGDDTDCVGEPSISFPRTKNVTLTINTSIGKEDYLLASMLSASIILGFCIAYVISVIIFKVRENRKNMHAEMLNNAVSQERNDCIPSPSVVDEIGVSQWTSVEEDSSLDEDDIDLLDDAFSDKEIIRTKLVLSVCDLARKDPKILRHKSRLYLYYLGTVAVFYTLPVVQLVVTYQHVLHVTGNQDMCYYNFLCAHPLGVLSDFNHVFSNFGYVVLGLLFIFLTYFREHTEYDKERNKSYGIPQHYGLFYAMGFALIMEGILSASYHVCPNHSNFQFDTSFMYIIAVLCMVKIYQTRHPDINARAPVAFGVLAFIIFVGLMGVLNGSTPFWIGFTIIHIFVCVVLTAQIYYMGRWRFDRGLITRIVRAVIHEARTGIRNLFRPLYCGRFILLVIANLFNVALAVLGNIYHDKNFATFLLAILMSNLLLYTFFYIVMKLCHKERILFQPLIYIILSILCWAAALYFFIHKTISWALTPAQSRLNNRPCELLRFFDSHDIWHFLSAFAMFFSFMVLLTLDDDLVDVHRSQIPVF